MGIKRANFNIKGMTRDLAASKFSPEYAYENKNIRLLTADSENTTGAIVNEIGPLYKDDIEGTPIGSATFNDKVIIFSADETETFNVKPLLVRVNEDLYKLLFVTEIVNGRPLNEYTPLEIEKGIVPYGIHPTHIDFQVVTPNIREIFMDNPLASLQFFSSEQDALDWNNGESMVNQYDNFYSSPNGEQIIGYKYDDEVDHYIYFRPKKSTITTGGDKIYKYNFVTENNVTTLEKTLLFEGDLNFDTKHPIEAIPIYESEDIQKVYWTDGYNQPRVINVEAPDDKRALWTNDRFNFVNKVGLKESISIERNLVATGYFAPGVLQYCFTYCNLYGQESNIFYTSPLFYVSYNDRGASPSDTVSNSFTITIDAGTYDHNFDYIRVYSLLRTSINGTPQARKVVDLAIPTDDTNDIVYTDTGAEGLTVDPTILLYLGGEDIIAKTITQKDNTLFLGNLSLNIKPFEKEIKDAFKNGTINFSTRFVETIPHIGSIYPYENSLKKGSENVKTLKYLEYYRFGIQLQYNTGKWSEAIWINDSKNTKHPSDGYLPYAYYNLNDTTLINKLVSLGYVKIRPVIVFPKISERSVICQGVVNPTVYNVKDRSMNSPFVQSSWFFRPNSYLDVDAVVDDWDKDGEYHPTTASPYTSWAAQVHNDIDGPTGGPTVNNFNRGKWAEFRHNLQIKGVAGTALPSSPENFELQFASSYLSVDTTNPDVNAWAGNNSENFYVDQSIITFHSPDIEFDTQVRSLDSSNLKFRIVGYVPLTASSSDISIQSETPVSNFITAVSPSNVVYSTNFPVGEYKEEIKNVNDSKFGWRAIISGGFWLDQLYNPYNAATEGEKTTGFVIFPWHRTGSYSNATTDSTGYRSAKTGKKKMSILRFSSFTSFIGNESGIWNAYEENSPSKTGVTDIAIFDSNELSLIKLKSPSALSQDISYYGNIDKVLSTTEKYSVLVTKQATTVTSHEIISANYSTISSDYSPTKTSSDPISIKYKSTPHAVIVLNYTNDNKQRIIPTNEYADYTPTPPKTYVTANNRNLSLDSNKHFFWDPSRKIIGVSQDIIEGTIIEPTYGYLWLGELYNDDPNLENTRFGGQTEEAFETNTWLPAGEAISLVDSDGNPETTALISWTEGDTYYQRYDCLKTYPFTMEDQNSVVDILSFMCETRVNLDGRYDRNRGQMSNLMMSPQNFNLLNPVYSQENNFFNYRAINSNKVEADEFKNLITWSKTKTLGEITDTWTNVTLASTLELDGDLGEITALRRFRDNILAFQNTGLSQVLYNENVQIASTTGVPIEIANSGKVTGKRYLSNKIGCTNKWSICTTPNGLYFNDTLSRDLYLFNGEFDNISNRLGFHSWSVDNLDSQTVWNPEDFGGCIAHYDNKNRDVLFTTGSTCLAFSEKIGQFTSFYDYQGTSIFEPLQGEHILFHKKSTAQDSPWSSYLFRKGSYNSFFNELKPFWTTVIVNPDATIDKIFNNLEYRADGFDSTGNYLKDYSFDTLDTWNEYQIGHSDLTNTKDKPSTLKKKFRIWRANIPRWNRTVNGQSPNNRDRMRNPWLYLKLSMGAQANLTGNKKFILHDLAVDYFE